MHGTEISRIGGSFGVIPAKFEVPAFVLHAAFEQPARGFAGIANDDHVAGSHRAPAAHGGDPFARDERGQHRRALDEETAKEETHDERHESERYWSDIANLQFGESVSPT